MNEHVSMTKPTISDAAMESFKAAVQEYLFDEDGTLRENRLEQVEGGDPREVLQDWAVTAIESGNGKHFRKWAPKKLVAHMAALATTDERFYCEIEGRIGAAGIACGGFNGGPGSFEDFHDGQHGSSQLPEINTDALRIGFTQGEPPSDPLLRAAYYQTLAQAAMIFCCSSLAACARVW